MQYCTLAAFLPKTIQMIASQAKPLWSPKIKEYALFSMCYLGLIKMSITIQFLTLYQDARGNL